MNYNLSKEIIAKITSIYRAITYINKVRLQNEKYQGNQLPFITRIHDNPGISQEELSVLLKIDRTTTSKAIKKLEDQGAVIRKKPCDDKRVWQLYVSDELLNDYQDIIDYLRYLYSITNCLTKEEMEVLYMLLNKVEKEASIMWSRFSD